MRVCFGPFVLDCDARQLLRDESAIHLSLKSFDLLATLVHARPNVVSKDALLKQLWADTFVAEANLSNLVAEIRHALGDSSREPRYIRTVHRIGYAFCGEATADPHGLTPGEPARFWIEWGTQRFPLLRGEHVIGRDADVAICIDASTVSRRHARIVIDGGVAVLEDFGSKNGTFRGKERVTAPLVLADGDAIRIGSQLLTFRVRSGKATETYVDGSR